MTVLRKMIDGIHTMSKKKNASSQITGFYFSDEIPANRKLATGFKDAGQKMKFNGDGIPCEEPEEPIVVVNSPNEEPALQEIIGFAQSGVRDQKTLKGKLEFLRDYVDNLMPNHEDKIEKNGISQPKECYQPGKETSLGELIMLGTGRAIDCSLLFKFLADHVELETSVHRGTIRDAQDDTYRDHVWNEVRDGHGDRIIVDVIQKGRYPVDDINVERYADRNNTQLYERRFPQYLAGYY